MLLQVTKQNALFFSWATLRTRMDGWKILERANGWEATIFGLRGDSTFKMAAGKLPAWFD